MTTKKRRSKKMALTPRQRFMVTLDQAIARYFIGGNSSWSAVENTIAGVLTSRMGQGYVVKKVQP